MTLKGPSQQGGTELNGMERVIECANDIKLQGKENHNTIKGMAIVTIHTFT
jgi:hypothetical protein